jgi:MFS-type transporter involved in bile tolerance (Atg22 family)
MQRYSSAPPSVKTATALFVAEVLTFFVGGFVGASQGHKSASTAGTGAIVAVSGAMLLAAFLSLALGIVFSRYPRRRHREAILFQALILFVCLMSAATDHPAVGTTLIAGLSVAIITLLLRPSARAFVAKREQVFSVGEDAPI